MEQEILTLLKQMDEKIDNRFEQIDKRLDNVDQRMDKIETRLDNVETRLDRIDSRLNQQERFLDSLIKMTAQNTEDITSLRTEANQRFDKLEFTLFKINSDINLLFQETQTNKRDIAQLKNQ
jgi:chromosome segregation ATPase